MIAILADTETIPTDSCLAVSAKAVTVGRVRRMIDALIYIQSDTA
jgi:hypothetical protein